MQQQDSKRILIAVWTMLIAVFVVVSVPAASQATGACPCQKLLQRTPHAEPVAHPLSLGTRLVQELDQMSCAQTCLLQETTMKRMRPYEDVRQRAAVALQETVNYLDLAVLQHLLTAEEAIRVVTFKQTFVAFQRHSSDIASMALLAENPAETAVARELASGQGQVAFDQAKGALKQLVACLGGAEPAADAVKAELGFPSVGTTWVSKTVVRGKDITYIRTNTVIEDATYGGRPVHRIRVSDGARIHLYDKATGNWTANVHEGGRAFQAASPYDATYAFPLWVGKIWQSTFNYKDRERGQTFSDVPWLGRVTAYEDVTVPAGTFKTFKVEGTDVDASKLVVWYAPNLHMPVKSIFERLPEHYLGPGKFTSELLEYAAK